MIGLYILASVAVICLTVWDIQRRNHKAAVDAAERQSARAAAQRNDAEAIREAKEAHAAALKEHIADRARYEEALKNHEMRIRDSEDYVRSARAPRAGGFRG
jgi:hypothetical protein